jgi:gliding motility-associated-like protein
MVVVTDVAGAQATQAYTIEVIEANDPPFFTSVPIETAREEDLYEYQVVSEDPDAGDVLTITAGQLPAWLSLVDHGDGTATLSGTPMDGDAGDVEIVLTARDERGEEAVQEFTLVIRPKGFGAPELKDINLSVEEDGVLTFSQGDFNAGYNDPDGDPIQMIIIESLPGHGVLRLGGSILNGSVELALGDIGSLEYVPDPDYHGPDGFSWNASDGDSFAAQSAYVNLQVTPVDDPPEDIQLSNSFVEEERPAGLTVGILTVEDQDSGDGYSYSFSPSNSADADAFVIDGDALKTKIELDYEEQDQYRILITAESDAGVSITREFIITVLDGEEAFFQTGITPNGDGHNDTWKINGLKNCPDCLVEIYNRWGQKIFSSVGYEKEWDGTYNDEVLPVGTYYYIVDYKNGRPPKKGAISILK